MAKVTKQIKQACAEAQKQLQGNPSVVSVGIGFKYRNGVRTDEICVVVGVKKKLPLEQVPEGQAVMAPSTMWPPMSSSMEKSSRTKRLNL